MSDEDLQKIRQRITRNSADVRKLLQTAQEKNIELSITGHLRGADIFGSSLDLPEFQRALTPDGVNDLNSLPSTVAIASEFTTTIKFELADNPNQIIYVAPDYGSTEENPYVFEGAVQLDNGRTPRGQLDGLSYVFTNIFGLSGIKITLDSISPMALRGYGIF